MVRAWMGGVAIPVLLFGVAGCGNQSAGRAGAARFERFTMADGLRPYGYMPDGSVPPGDKYLKVISVSGAWAGTVFAGYEGKPPGPGALGCEDNWDGPKPDPAIYKSGDAD